MEGVLIADGWVRWSGFELGTGKVMIFAVEVNNGLSCYFRQVPFRPHALKHRRERLKVSRIPNLI